LPTLVLPIIATGIPCFIALPVLNDFNKEEILLSILFARYSKSSLFANSSSS
jgi:hypothetical protein